MKLQVKERLTAVVLYDGGCDFSRLMTADENLLRKIRQENIWLGLTFAVMTGRACFSVPGVQVRGAGHPADPDAPDDGETPWVTTSPVQEIYFEDEVFYFRTRSGSLYACASDTFLEEDIRKLVAGLPRCMKRAVPQHLVELFK